ncbi:hypothetical protein MSG28_013478 [Choristoneura fumiferana]|uniref:Uncharacterized protein n=1 Tax=Choristoneura fumiferana TaxID=7141 RepID=A0ACC0KU20_CHOFU|nr:hypothetical protein MSG28_013478 [Choristoneura fumiferana]
MDVDSNDTLDLEYLWIFVNIKHMEQITIPDEVVEEVDECNEQLRLKDGELLSILKRLATIVADEEYMAELLAINNKVVQLSAGH